MFLIAFFKEKILYSFVLSTFYTLEPRFHLLRKIIPRIVYIEKACSCNQRRENGRF